MGEEFYAVLKLTSSEEILSLVSIDENDGDPLIILQNPVTIKLIHSTEGISIKIKSWMEIATDDFFIIRPDKVITMTETKDKKIIGIYNDFINDDLFNPYNPSSKESSGKTKPSKSMGYLTSVEEARKNLENIFNNSI